MAIPNQQGPIFPDLIIFDVWHPSLVQNELYAYDNEINANLAKEIFEELEYTVTVVSPPDPPNPTPSDEKFMEAFSQILKKPSE